MSNQTRQQSFGYLLGAIYALLFGSSFLLKVLMASAQRGPAGVWFDRAIEWPAQLGLILSVLLILKKGSVLVTIFAPAILGYSLHLHASNIAKSYKVSKNQAEDKALFDDNSAMYECENGYSIFWSDKNYVTIYQNRKKVEWLGLEVDGALRIKNFPSVVTYENIEKLKSLAASKTCKNLDAIDLSTLFTGRVLPPLKTRPAK